MEISHSKPSGPDPIGRYLIESGMSQAEFARETGLSVRLLSHTRHLRQQISLETAALICEATGSAVGAHELPISEASWRTLVWYELVPSSAKRVTPVGLARDEAKRRRKGKARKKRKASKGRK